MKQPPSIPQPLLWPDALPPSYLPQHVPGVSAWPRVRPRLHYQRESVCVSVCVCLCVSFSSTHRSYTSPSVATPQRLSPPGHAPVCVCVCVCECVLKTAMYGTRSMCCDVYIG